MQLHISHSCKTPIVLPVNYHHILQGIVYNSLAHGQPQGTCLAESLHDNTEGLKREYKFFQFSEISGHYSFYNRKLTFDNTMSWEIRTPDRHIIMAIKRGIEENGIKYGDIEVDNVRVELTDNTIEFDEICIRMSTPICVYSTDPETKKTYFYSPDEDEFYEGMCDNFVRKYEAYSGNVPNGTIEIEPLNVFQKDKYVTKYKGFYISGWRGEYILRGNRKYIDFLYQTGLGAKNSQGFGMFNVIEP